MPNWIPKNQVFDERGAKDALINYFVANQADSLLWANDGVKLPKIEKFQKQTAYVIGAMPYAVFNRTSHTSSFEGDFLIVNFAVEIEVWLKHGKQDVLSDLAPKYAMALESMLANLPDTTFGNNSKIQITTAIEQLETVYDVQGKLNKGGFIQIFQTSAQWRIEASAYSS